LWDACTLLNLPGAAEWRDAFDLIDLSTSNTICPHCCCTQSFSLLSSMPRLQLFFDPTHGYVCSCCFRAVDPKQPPIPVSFRSHLEQCHDEEEGWTFDGEYASAELQRVRSVAEQFARCIAACSSDAQRVGL